MIRTRNEIVTTNLKTLYGGRISDGNLHVFCASNTLYWANRRLRPRDRAAVFLELSGIVAIRRHCMALVSESQYRIATKYLRDDIPDVLSHVDLWVQTGAGTADAERKRAVREAVYRFGDRLRRVSTSYRTEALTG